MKDALSKYQWKEEVSAGGLRRFIRFGTQYQILANIEIVNGGFTLLHCHKVIADKADAKRALLKKLMKKRLEEIKEFQSLYDATYEP